MTLCMWERLQWWRAGCMGALCVRADSFFYTVTSPYHKRVLFCYYLDCWAIGATVLLQFLAMGWDLRICYFWQPFVGHHS